MAKPTVTVGMCARNAELVIREAIESLLGQDFPHEFMEVIFVDDGSEDETLSVIESCVPKMDMKTRVFEIEWSGLGRSRNMVVENARGKYIAWVDADMLLSTSFVTKQVEFMEKNPNVGMGKARYGDNREESLTEFLENAAYQAADLKYGGRPMARAVGAGGSIYRVEAIRQIGGFDEQIRGAGEDIDAEYRAREAGWLLYLATPATFYERRRKTWKELWKEGFWHGYGIHYVFRKNPGSISLIEMSPPAGFVAGLMYSIVAYKMTRRKTVFLLPFQYTFKRVAWVLGFVKGQRS